MKIPAPVAAQLVVPGFVLVGVGVLAFLAWRAVGRARELAGEVFDDVGQALVLKRAEISEAWGNAWSIAPPGDPVRQALYSDEGYTGRDPITGRMPGETEAYSDPEFLRYMRQSREAYERASRPAPVESSEGAAFGVYANAGRRRPRT